MKLIKDYSSHYLNSLLESSMSVKFWLSLDFKCLLVIDLSSNELFLRILRTKIAIWPGNVQSEVQESLNVYGGGDGNDGWSGDNGWY